MRIPDEQQLYRPGDEVTIASGKLGIVDNVLSNSVYYEARPIASYTQYTYVVTCEDGQRHYLKADEISCVS